LFKSPFYVEARLRRELWTLAHAHGTLLGVLNIVFAVTAAGCLPAERSRRRVSRLMLAGGGLVPLGFFLGGVGNAEGDPSVFIVLVPAGALFLFLAVARTVAGALRKK
jgi:hypothetical protein